MARTATMRRPRMTAQDATSFTGYSVASMMQISMAIGARAEAGVYPDCTCEPYADTFTFARWIAQGFAVRKGEKSLRISTFTPVGERTVKNADEPSDGADTPSVRLRPCTAFLFCRCQVDAKVSK